VAGVADLTIPAGTKAIATAQPNNRSRFLIPISLSLPPVARAWQSDGRCRLLSVLVLCVVPMGSRRARRTDRPLQEAVRNRWKWFGLTCQPLPKLLGVLCSGPPTPAAGIRRPTISAEREPAPKPGQPRPATLSFPFRSPSVSSTNSAYHRRKAIKAASRPWANPW
jgi:hypothetical protein